jgi:luciferase family oxidoreductase group 1
MKKIKYSVLDLAPVIAGKTATEAFANSLDLAQHTEALGYHRYWLAEHHNMDGIASSATSVLIGHIAGGTKTIRVGSGGIMLPNHSSLIIAEQFGTLNALYPNRIDLGLGRAPGTNQATMRALRRNLMTDDFDTQVKELFEYFYPETGQIVNAYPGAGQKVPIWLLGSSLYSAKLAGQLGLPYSFASHFAPEMMLDALYVYRENFRPSEFLNEPYVMLGVQAVVAPTDEEAEFLTTTIYQRFLALIKNQSLKLQPPVESMQGLWSAIEEHHVREKLQTSVRGSVDKAKYEIEKLAKMTQADELMFTSDVYDHKLRRRSFELIAKAIQ